MEKQIKGKKQRLKNDRFKVLYGSAINRNIKSFYLSVNTWMEPQEPISQRALSNLGKNIRQSIWNSLQSNNLVIRDRIITDFNYPIKHAIKENRMFVTFDATFFINQVTNICSPEIKSIIDGVVKSVISSFDSADKIKYYRTKK